MHYLKLLIIPFFIGSNIVAQKSLDSAFLEFIQGKDELVDRVIFNQDKFRLQLMLSKYDGEQKNLLDWTNEDYYYPASLVKLPTVIATLNKLKEFDISLDDYIRINSDRDCGSKRFVTKSQQEKLSFRTIIEEVIVVSDNDYYNLLYHFVGPQRINDCLQKISCDSTKIYRCFTGCDKEEHLHTFGFSIYNSNDSLVFESKSNDLNWDEIESRFFDSPDKHVGNKRMEGKKILNESYDFTYNLEYPIRDLQTTMIELMNWTPESEHWDFREEDYRFLLNCLKLFPRELTNEKYQNKSKYGDNAFKIIAFGDLNQIREGIITYSKIGYSYGFITETAYVIDSVSKQAFYLTISMYVNQNGVMNDGQYEYNSIATPFMGRLTNFIIEFLATKK